jgi:hypothetical protein
VEGVSYTARITLRLNSGYNISSSATVTVNASIATVTGHNSAAPVISRAFTAGSLAQAQQAAASLTDALNDMTNITATRSDATVTVTSGGILTDSITVPGGVTLMVQSNLVLPPILNRTLTVDQGGILTIADGGELRGSAEGALRGQGTLIINSGGRLLISYDYDHDTGEGGINFAAMNNGMIRVNAGGELGIASEFDHLDHHVLLIGTMVSPRAAYYRLGTGNIEIRIVNSDPIFTLSGLAAVMNEHEIFDGGPRGAFVNEDDRFNVALGSTLTVFADATFLVLGEVWVDGTIIVRGGHVQVIGTIRGFSTTASTASIQLEYNGSIAAGNLFENNGTTAIPVASFLPPDGALHNRFTWAGIGTGWRQGPPP